MFDNSHNYATFSGVASEMNGLKPAQGRTDSSAAATSLSIVFLIVYVGFIEENFPSKCC